MQENSQNATLTAVSGEPIVLQRLDLTGDLRGLLFEAQLTQTFRNPGKDNMELVYSFPLPWNAVLLGIEVTLGDRPLSGQITPRETATARYEEAISEGDSALLLERLQDGSYSLNLGNLLAHEECVIRLRYAQTLRFEQQALRLLIPTTLAPRYGDAVREGGLQPHQVTDHSLTVEYPFTLQLTLHGDLARARMASPSHPISVSLAGDGTMPAAQIALARDGWLDRDFVLTLDRLEHTSLAVLGRDLGTETGRVALLSLCPRVRQEESPALSCKVLVDCSGSMLGDSIEAAKRALLAMVDQLSDQDRFSLSRFGSQVEHRSRGLWKATDLTRTAARRWITDLDADLGGTEMEAALHSTFRLAHQDASDVLLITDGEIYAIDSVIETARGSGHRVFVVGIGSSPVESHLRRLAEATGGGCDFVAPGEAVEPAVLRMFNRLRSPHFSDLHLTWPNGVRPGWISPLPSAVFDGDTLNLFAFLPEVAEGRVRLDGRLGADREPEVIGEITLRDQTEPGDTLARMGMQQRLQGEGAEALDEATATDLAVRYRLVSDHTHFLLVHQRQEQDRPERMPELHQVRQMLPAGWGGSGIVVYSPDVEDLHLELSLEDVEAGSTDTVRVFDCLDIMPAPSRRASRSKAPQPLAYSREDHYQGLTPFGLAEWLRDKTASEWPSSYRELTEIGVGAWLIDWLDLVLASSATGDVSEEILVGLFVRLFAQPATHRYLSASNPAPEAYRTWAKGLTRDSDLSDQQLELLMRLIYELQTMTEAAWPDTVFSLSMTFGQDEEPGQPLQG